jgi:hypothetical protein
VDTDTDLGPALVARSAFDGGTLDDTGALGDTGVAHPKHGTYVAGVIASQIDGVGTNGIWPAAKVLSRRVFPGPDAGTTAIRYINAIDWCVNAGASVKAINLSVAGLSATVGEKTNLEDRITRARTIEGVNVVAAAGNNGMSTVGYPASASGVFAVGATDANGAFWPDSNRGSGLDIATLGVDTCLTVGGGTRLGLGSGTSFAAPVVSAVLAALRTARPDMTPDQAEQLVLDNAGAAPAGKVLNAARAFQAAGLLTAEQAAQAYPPNACEPPPITGGVGAAVGIGEGLSAVALAKADVPTAHEPPDSPTMPTPSVDLAPRTDDTFRERRPAKPRLRSIRFRRGVLTVKVAGYRVGRRTAFRVNSSVRVGPRTRTQSRTYVRSSGELRVRAKNWSSVRVQVRAATARSEPLIIRRLRDF